MNERPPVSSLENKRKEEKFGNLLNKSCVLGRLENKQTGFSCSEQTSEHALLAFTLGVRQIICCCNEMGVTANTLRLELVRQAAAKTNGLAGDGTTTSVVLAQGLSDEDVKIVAAVALYLRKVGAEIVKRALSYPLKLIAKTAGVNESVVSEKVFSSDNSKYEYNASAAKVVGSGCMLTLKPMCWITFQVCIASWCISAYCSIYSDKKAHFDMLCSLGKIMASFGAERAKEQRKNLKAKQSKFDWFRAQKVKQAHEEMLARNTTEYLKKLREDNERRKRAKVV
nr:Chaperone tailless complex polypeptide 1 (TCP-1) [Ipomoea trifida]